MARRRNCGKLASDSEYTCEDDEWGGKRRKTEHLRGAQVQRKSCHWNSQLEIEQDQLPDCGWHDCNRDFICAVNCSALAPAIPRSIYEPVRPSPGKNHRSPDDDIRPLFAVICSRLVCTRIVRTSQNDRRAAYLASIAVSNAYEITAPVQVRARRACENTRPRAAQRCLQYLHLRRL